MDERPDEPADADRDDRSPSSTVAPAATDGEPGDEASDPRLGDGVEHLQTAVREVIAAARTFLDVAEDVVGDRAAVASVADLLGSVSEAVTRAGTDRSRSGGAGSNGGEADQEPGVQHIQVT